MQEKSSELSLAASVLYAADLVPRASLLFPLCERHYLGVRGINTMGSLNCCLYTGVINAKEERHEKQSFW